MEYDYEIMLDMLKNTKINITWSRQHGAGIGRSLSFGYGRIRKYKGINEFKANHTYPELYEELQRMAEILCPFECNSIIVNHNFKCAMHTDKNKSDSIIVGLGDYKGGELSILERVDDVGRRFYDCYDIKYNPMQFNGYENSHWTEPFTGERYSIIFTNIA
jgi:hypothetical protein